MTSQRVSLGMPVHNGEQYIGQALESLLSQTHENFELVISDNASTDRTWEICQSYASRDERIRLYRNRVNIGAVANFNRVLALSRSPFFMWAACDDLWEPTFIQRLLGSLNSDPDAILAFSAFNSIGRRGTESKTHPDFIDLCSRELFARLHSYLLLEEYLGKANLIYGLMRRNALQEAGGFRVWGEGSWGQDMLVVFRLLSLGGLVLSRDLLFHKRLVTPSTPVSHRETSVSLAGKFTLALQTLRDRHGYFSGYARIISIIEALTTVERARLRALLLRRTNRLYFREIKAVFVSPAAQWIAKHTETHRIKEEAST